MKGHVGWQILIFVLAVGLAGTLVWWQWDSSRHQYTEQPEPPKLRELPSLEIPTTAPAVSNEFILAHASQFDPATVARAIPNHDPRLLEWMESYVRRPAGHPNDLEAILKSSEMDFNSLYSLSCSMRVAAAAKPVHTATVSAALLELSVLRPGDPRADTILHRLWHLGETLYALQEWETAERMYAGMSRFDPPAPTVARTAAYYHAEVVYLQRRYAEALAEFDRISNRASQAMPLVERAEIEWAKGLMLYSLGRFSESIPHLKDSTVAGQSQHRKLRMEFLVYALVRSQQLEKASQQLDVYIQTFHPSPEEIMPMQRAIDGNASLALGAHQ